MKSNENESKSGTITRSIILVSRNIKEAGLTRNVSSSSKNTILMAAASARPTTMQMLKHQDVSPASIDKDGNINLSITMTNERL
jgi:hypothetical protein